MMTPTTWPGQPHHKTISVQDNLDIFWSNTTKLLQNQDQVSGRVAMQSRPVSSQNSMDIEVRLRANTTTSAMSFYENPTTDDYVGDVSRPVSQHTRDASWPQSSERKPNAAKTLLSKGSRILRRQGSKLSLLSSSSVEHQGLEKSFSSSSLSSDPLVKQHERQSSAADLKRDAMKRNISEPYNFKHVTHTDLGHLRKLEHVNRNELISEFTALRAGQRAHPELQGIRADSLPSTKPSPEIDGNAPPASPTATILPSLPLTPPRPQPPPKDLMRALPAAADVRLSKSYENFSRPVSRSPVSPVSPVYPVSHPRRKSSLVPPQMNPPQEYISPYCNYIDNTKSEQGNLVHDSDASTSQKALPGLPQLIHAVSTTDDTARPLRTAPLPRIPPNLADVPEEDEVNETLLKRRSRKHSRSMSLRHAQTFPSAKELELRQSYKDNFPLKSDNVSGAESVLLSSGSTTSAESDSESKPSAVRTIDVQDWEEAIDYSWDHAAEPEAEVDWTHVNGDVPSGNIPMAATHHQPELSAPLLSPTIATRFDDLALLAARRLSSQAQSNQALTPSCALLNQATGPSILPIKFSNTQPPVSPCKSSPLFGLGIEAPHIVVPAEEETAWSNEAIDDMRVRRGNTAHYSSGSGISKSSSQESIILSIASSIMSTHRSSNSSTSLADSTPSMLSIKESWIESLPESPQDSNAAFDLHSFSSSLEGSASDSFTEALRPVTAGAAVASASVSPVRHQPQHPVLPISADHRRAKSLAPTFIFRDGYMTPNSSDSLRADSSSGTVSPLSSTHSRSGSASRLPVPVRTSSITAVVGEPKRPSTGYRKRSHTTSMSRPRHTSRCSYSLFPGASPSVAP